VLRATGPLVFVLLGPAAHLGAQSVPLRVQVVDREGRPAAGLRVLAQRRLPGIEPERSEAVTAGADAVATFPQWVVGSDKATVELRVAMLGPSPRRVVDLAHGLELPVRLQLPAVHALDVALHMADGTDLPAPLAANLEVIAVADDAAEVGSEPVQLRARLDGAHHRVFPVALGVPVRLRTEPLFVGTRDEPAWTDAAVPHAIDWRMPTDLVALVGRMLPSDSQDPSTWRITVTLDGRDRLRGFAARDGTFAAAFLGARPERTETWIGKTPTLLISVAAPIQASAEPVLAQPLAPGRNELGEIRLRDDPLWVAGTLRLDGKPVPAGTVVRCTLLFTKPFPGPYLPIAVRTDAGGRFAVRAPLPPDCKVVVDGPGPDYRTVGNNRFAPGSSEVVVDLERQVHLAIDVLFDDARLADPKGYHIGLRREQDGKVFGTLLEPKPGTPAGTMTGRWRGTAGGTFRLWFQLRATGEVLGVDPRPIEIEQPFLGRSRTLPALDLRGRLRLLRVRAALPPADPHAVRELFLRPATGGAWTRTWLGPATDHVVAAPVDVIAFGTDVRFEQHLACEGELLLAARPATRVTVRIEPAPRPLKDGCALELEASHPLCNDGEPTPYPGMFTRTVGQDGSAVLGLPFAGAWQVQLWVKGHGAAPIAVGDPIEVSVGNDTDRAVTHRVPPASLDPYSRRDAPRRNERL
jgi:hypothetical protein